MQYEELITSIQQLGKDPARLIFEDELTAIPNRRFLLNYFEHQVRWDALDVAPISLLMMDVDYFKKINDTHGHDAGDQALAHVARLLKDVSGEQSIPVRYAGDEFIILTGGLKDEALILAETLLERIHAEPLRLAGGVELPLTLSIGVATAPDNAKNGKELVRQADTALYQAKRAGRDRIAHVSDTQPDVVSDKLVLQQLVGGAICTRQEELDQVQNAIQQFDQGKGRFILVDGVAGMGKTTFLETVRRLLQGRGEGQGQGIDAYVVRTIGLLQEDYRPYYLMTSILIALLGQRDDKGEAAYRRLTKVEVSFLGALLPQMEGPKELRLAPDQAMRREGIFSAVSKFLYLLLDYRPLALLIDDLHYADEASLTVLKRLLAHNEVPLLLCGTAMAPGESSSAEQETPLAKLLADRSSEVPIVRISLKPLTADNIAAHLREIFPKLAAPPDTEIKLARVTQGSPQFLNELLRKWVVERKLRPVGEQWVLDPFEERDLPPSLEELLQQKIDTLDAEGRNLLAQTSVLGENVSLSVLTGSADATEIKVQDFVDHASALGLLSADYQVNDEKIRFAGKTVLDVAYKAIGEATRKALHEKVGNYQETLFKKRLLPSAAPLAHHFTRSTNSQKAAAYARVVATDNTLLFNVQEAGAYKSEGPTSTETPLDPASLSFVPTVVRSLQTAVRNRRLYAADNKNVVNPRQEFIKNVQQVLAKNERLDIVETRRSLLVNGQRVNDVGEYEFVAKPFRAFLDAAALRGLTVLQGVTDDELNRLLEGFAQTKPEQIDEHYWSRFAADHGLAHIALKQTAGLPKAVVESEAIEPMAGEATPPVGETEETAVPAAGVPAEQAEALTQPIVMAPVAVVQRSAQSLAPVRAETAAEEMTATSLDALLSSFSDLATDVLLRGGGAQLGTLLTRLFQGIRTQDEATRGRVVEAVKAAFLNVPVGFQQEFVRQAIDQILQALEEEQNPKTGGELARLARQMACAVVPFAEYRPACRLLMGLKAKLARLEQAHDPRADVLVEVLERPLEPAMQRLLMDDLKSADPTRQEQAFQLLGSFGLGAVPTLIEVIKHEADLRVRQLAANLLAPLGARAAKAYKKELVLEITPEERVRMLEVGETVTRALRTELAFALGDANPGVREAAYGLAVRLNDARLTPLLVDYAAHKDPVMAAGAIKCLGKLKPPKFTNLLLGIMKSAKDPALQVACCQTLGQVADPAAFEPLARIVAPKGFLRLHKRWSADVRAAAAHALAQIPDPRVAKVLARLAKDADPRLRQLARTPIKK
ncbi:MAG: diguanylate cyclase [Nitrospirae bacterium]|nr:MAG: diguanylate cyclase [Nitrospirota bacterium]